MFSFCNSFRGLQKICKNESDLDTIGNLEAPIFQTGKRLVQCKPETSDPPGKLQPCLLVWVSQVLSSIALTECSPILLPSPRKEEMKTEKLRRKECEFVWQIDS
jgi:hypothetical protein